MKNRRINVLILLVISVLMVSCLPETSAPEATVTAVPIVEAPTPTPEETASEGNVSEGTAPVGATAEATAAVKDPGLKATLAEALANADLQTLEAMMNDSFVIGYWESGSQRLTPAEAVEQLQLNLLPDPMTLRFTVDRDLFPDLGDVDPTKVYGYKVKVVDLVYSEGWGADGQGEAILTIGLTPEGQYWPGMIYAPAGFEEADETNDGLPEGSLTFINEHAGYAFDYPAGWIISGGPAPDSYMYAITLRSHKPGMSTGPVPADQVKLDFVTCNSAECPTLPTIEARIDEQVAAGELEIRAEENWTLAGGVPAVRRRLIGEMNIEVASLVTVIDGRVLRVGGYGNLDAVDSILRTLRPAISQPNEGELRAHLEIPESLPVGQPVKLRFYLINDTDSRLYVLNWYTPLEGIGGEIFRVRRDGVPVPYQGILASRAEPTPETYTVLDVGEMVSAEVDLADAFDFSVPGEYAIEFISPRISHIAKSEAEMATTFDELGPVQIPANEVTVRIDAESHPVSEVEAAQEALRRYFALLSEGKYADAVDLHGGGYGALRGWNPTADPDDLAGLLESGCKVNGLVCRPVKTISPMGAGSPTVFEFAVQFENPDGSLFVLNPEGDWPEGEFPRSSFKFTVLPIGDGFAVQELPISTP
ncbi:MAG: hypothetical protein JSW55_08185 [Chloroflexota bacterium]|nr:MAG: hypothetical protein JSW55_08185 [Chloroflexota bacterium]